MRTTLTAVLAILLVLALALAGCSKQEEAQGPTEIVPGLSYVDSVIGQGADPDIITAAAKAYLNALNRLVFLNQDTTGKS